MLNGDTPIRSARNAFGATPSRVRDHNARSILTLLRDRGALSGAEIARVLSVSAQTASVILRALEEQGLLIKGEAKKGKVGKPQMPYVLNQKGSYALGLRLGRRSTDMVLMDLVGDVRAKVSVNYSYPTPDLIEGFVKNAIQTLTDNSGISVTQLEGIGVASPFELWNWLDALGAPKAEADLWRDYSLTDALWDITNIPVFVANDMTMACNAERMFGNGKTMQDFGYFYVGSFVGGGLVLNGKVFHGDRANAGAFGSIPTQRNARGNQQLIHSASLYSLESAISEKNGSRVMIRANSALFEAEPLLVEAWLKEAAEGLAVAMTAVTAVLDIQDIILDGAFPTRIKESLIQHTQSALKTVDQQGLNPFQISPGALGKTAGARGAAYEPLIRAYFLEGSGLT